MVAGGHAWLRGACVVVGGMVVGGMHGCRGGVCGWGLGGMHGCGGVCVVVGEHVWLWGGMHGYGGHVWWGGMHWI